MLLVVDVNVVFSALYSKGLAYEVFAINRICKFFDFVTLEFLFFELGKRMDKLLLKSKLSKEEIAEILGFLKEEIEIMPAEEFGEFVPKAKQILEKHPKDVPYLALALALNCEIFSGDKKLKELSHVKVFSPRELMDILSKRFLSTSIP